MKKIGEKILFKGNWLNLIEKTFENRKKELFEWECVERIRDRLVVIVIAKLLHSGKYVLIKQFRCPVNNYILGFPAGVTSLDKGPEEIETEALRELKEETGYTGRILGRSPLLKANYGIMDDNLIQFTASIDEKEPINLNPVQSLEPEEDIEIILKSGEEIPAFLLEEQKKGVGIGAGIWNYFGQQLLK